MASVDILKNSFTSGELSPLAQMRADLPRYQNGAALLENFRVLVQGGLARRGGGRYVATAGAPTGLTIVKTFEPGNSDDLETLEAFTLEFGNLLMRFCKNGVQVLDGVTPVQVTTPYTSDQLRRIRTAQSNDVMILVHPKHAQAQLSHLSDISWTYKPIVFEPPPLYEAGFEPAATLTVSALTGIVTLTASASVFLRADVDRVIQAGDVRIALTAYTSGTVMTGEVLSALTTLAPIAAGDWEIQGSPMALLHPPDDREDIPPRGSLIELDLQLKQDENPELLTNPAFVSALTGWTDLSDTAIVTGTHTGDNDAVILEDSTQNFWASGVHLGHMYRNTVTDAWGTVASLLTPTALSLVNIGSIAAPIYLYGGGVEIGIDTGEAYTITGTGGVEVRDAQAYLTGGVAGIGWLEQAVTTVSGQAYRVTFEVSEGTISAQVGSASGKSDLKEELAYVQGNEHELLFVATGATSYIQFRNNQPTWAVLVRASCKLHSVSGFRSADVGRYIEVSGGLVKILALLSASRVRVEIRRELSTLDAVLPGAWRLLSPAWSATLGYPNALCFFEGRLYFGGSARFPKTIWGSAVNDFYNFAPGAVATDAVEFTIINSAGNIYLDVIRWLMPGENLLAGTTDAEYRLSGPTEGGFTPTDPPLVRLQSSYGSDFVQPLRIGQALLFAQRMGSKLRQMAFDAESASAFLARDLSILSGHLLEDYRIVDMAYQSEPTSTVWAVRSDGVLLGLTYDLLEEVVGWHHHTTDGFIESVAVVPHPTANAHQVWITVRRNLGGVVTRTIEYLDDQAVMSYPIGGGDTASWKGLTLDCAVVYNGAATTTLTGLVHLNGETVSIVGDGMVLPPQVVSAGQVTLPQAVRRAFVGLPYVPRGTLLPPELVTQRGTSQLRRKQYKALLVALYQTVGLTIAGEVLPFRTTDMAMDRGIPPYTGDMVLDGLLGDGERRPTLSFSQPDPLPCTITAIVGALEMDLDG